MPVCPAGHKLRTQFLGDLTDLSLGLALLRGLALSIVAILFGILQDLGRRRTVIPCLGMAVLAGFMVIIGLNDLADAWRWSGKGGPVYRLTPRAFGMALGFLVPALVAMHALYFRWAGSLEHAVNHLLLALLHTFQQIRG